MAYGRDAFVYATQGTLNGTCMVALVALAIFTIVPQGLTLLVRANRVRRVREEYAAAKGF